MVLKRAPRWLLFGDDRQINIQMMANKIWIQPRSLVCALCKHINIPHEKLYQLFLLLKRQLISDLEKLLFITPMMTFPNSLHLAPFITTSANDIAILDCYRPCSTEVKDSTLPWYLIAATKHCLAIDKLPTNSSTWSPDGYFTFKCRVEETAPGHEVKVLPQWPCGENKHPSQWSTPPSLLNLLARVV